jgi:hypothetical protein
MFQNRISSTILQASHNSEKWIFGSSLLPVHSSLHIEYLDSHWTDYQRKTLFEKFKKLWKKFLTGPSLVKLTVTVHKDKCPFITTSRRILLRKRNVTEIIWRQNQKIRFRFYNLLPKNRDVYVIM